eukprot:2802161-Prymnesium_polylepis.1
MCKMSAVSQGTWSVKARGTMSRRGFRSRGTWVVGRVGGTWGVSTRPPAAFLTYTVHVQSSPVRL